MNRLLNHILIVVLLVLAVPVGVYERVLDTAGDVAAVDVVTRAL